MIPGGTFIIFEKSPGGTIIPGGKFIRESRVQGVIIFFSFQIKRFVCYCFWAQPLSSQNQMRSQSQNRTSGFNPAMMGHMGMGETIITITTTMRMKMG